jgi:hypothetical protein
VNDTDWPGSTYWIGSEKFVEHDEFAEPSFLTVTDIDMDSHVPCDGFGTGTFTVAYDPEL